MHALYSRYKTKYISFRDTFELTVDYFTRPELQMMMLRPLLTQKESLVFKPYVVNYLFT
jgi:hypothetical protein